MSVTLPEEIQLLAERVGILERWIVDLEKKLPAPRSDRLPTDRMPTWANYTARPTQ